MSRLAPQHTDATWWAVRPHGTFALPTDLAARLVDDGRPDVRLGHAADVFPTKGHQPTESPNVKRDLTSREKLPVDERAERLFDPAATPSLFPEPAADAAPAATSIRLDLNSVADYETFLRVKRLPVYSVRGRTLTFPAEYAHLIGRTGPGQSRGAAYEPAPFLFDYQAGIARLAIRKGKLGAFVRCGLGKTLIFLEFARHCVSVLPTGRRVLILSPAMVVDQTREEAAKFYGDSLPVEAVAPSKLSAWLTADGPTRIGIASYNSLADDTPRGNLGALILDESSMLKSAYGAWGRHCVRLGKGLAYKLALTGTPAPNDRIEFANHAVFLDAYPTVNSFLARFFVNRGQTDNRWEMKPHATGPFYRALSHWSIFLNSPATYGWRDNADTIPPVRVHVDDVPLTDEQKRIAQDATGMLIAGAGTPGGITSRGVLAQLAKGTYKGRPVPTAKPEFIRKMVESWPTESTIVWCHYNAEQDSMEAALPGAATIRGSTKHAERQQIIADFKAGRVRTLVTKPDVLGFGLNLQVATRHVFSGLQDSYEDFHQAVCRSNRVGSTKPLDVHIPVTPIERPMIDTVLAKADRVDRDNEEQERIFKENAAEFLGEGRAA